MDVHERLTGIEDTQKTILEAVTELKMAVCGSEKIKVKGLIDKVNEHDCYIEKDRRQKWMIAGAISLITVLLFIYEKIK